jgi:hypothetical protein
LTKVNYGQSGFLFFIAFKKIFAKIMQIKKMTKLKIFIFAAIAILIFSNQASAIFDLSYILTEGGFRLEFNQRNFSSAVTFTAYSDIAKRYEIRQRIDSPLRSRDNPSIVIRDNFVVRGIRGSNRYGDLRIPPTDTTVRNDELIYVSTPTGKQDSFTLVYSIINPQTLTPGYYTGRIGLILKPIDSVQAQVTKIIDVYVSIHDDGTLPSITITSEESLNTLTLKANSNTMRNTANAIVSIDGGFREPFKIMQLVNLPIQSQEGKVFDYKNILFNILDAKVGVGINQPTLFTNTPQIIYSSKPDGSSDKVFAVTYSLANPFTIPAGKYRTHIQYILESSGKQVNLGMLNLEIIQERIFELLVTPQDQRYSIDFNNLKPGEGPHTNEVLIEVNTNTNKRYQVTQEVISDLTTSTGEKIPSENFLIRTLPVKETKGKVKLTDKSRVEKGGRLLFISDNNGSSDTFKIIYELNCPSNLKAGNYSSRITYTLTEI